VHTCLHLHPFYVYKFELELFKYLHRKLKPGINVMILEIFSPKKSVTNGVFDSKQSFSMQNVIITLVFEKNTNFSSKSAENHTKL
jgi:hypothetical protein